LGGKRYARCEWEAQEGVGLKEPASYFLTYGMVFIRTPVR